MRLLLVGLALLALAAAPALGAEQRWFVQGQYSGGCPADRTKPIAFKAQPVGCVPLSLVQGNSWVYFDCQNGSLISKMDCNDSTCEHCTFTLSRPFTNGTESECAVSGGTAAVQECVVGEPSYPPNAPIVKYYEQLKCAGTPYSVVSGLATASCVVGAKVYCSGSKVVSELWKDGNCSTSIQYRVKAGRTCLKQNYDPDLPPSGSFLTYCAAHTLVAPVALLALLLALLL